MELVNELPFQDPFQGKRCRIVSQKVLQQHIKTQKNMNITEHGTFYNFRKHKQNPAL